MGKFVQQRDALAIQVLEGAQDFLCERFQWFGLHSGTNGIDLLIRQVRFAFTPKLFSVILGRFGAGWMLKDSE